MSADVGVLFEKMAGIGGNLGVITLNRPSVLNSLDHAMVQAMHNQLLAWTLEDDMKAVVIRAAPGRAFCAGGDLRLTYERIKSREPIMQQFFIDEYRLNKLIYHYPKPYIALLDGITMGGGVGISIHGSHRVCTNQLLFAMPETGIGFFPDVGGTFFLPRLPHQIGFYLGLTGARITSDDCLRAGIVTHKVERTVLPDVIDALARTKFVDDAKASVTHVLSQFNQEASSSQLIEQQQDIQHCFAAGSVEEIMDALGEASSPICKNAVDVLNKKSPTSLKVTLHALLAGKQVDFDACMRQEFRMVSRFLQSYDFIEGIRAVIIDKDQAPRWQPSRLVDVTEDEVNKYFAPLSVELV